MKQMLSLSLVIVLSASAVAQEPAGTKRNLKLELNQDDTLHYEIATTTDQVSTMLNVATESTINLTFVVTSVTADAITFDVRIDRIRLVLPAMGFNLDTDKDPREIAYLLEKTGTIVVDRRGQVQTTTNLEVDMQGGMRFLGDMHYQLAHVFQVLPPEPLAEHVGWEHTSSTSQRSEFANPAKWTYKIDAMDQKSVDIAGTAKRPESKTNEANDEELSKQERVEAERLRFTKFTKFEVTSQRTIDPETGLLQTGSSTMNTVMTTEASGREMKTANSDKTDVMRTDTPNSNRARGSAANGGA